MSRIWPAALAFSFVAALPAQGDDCVHRAERQARVEASGARALRVEAKAGSLRVEGKPGATAVVVHGVACASRASRLEEVQVAARRAGDGILVEAVIPEGSWLDNGSAGLDLVIEVPAGLAVEIEDGSGAAEVVSVASVRMVDGSGSLLIRDVAGDVRITDGSGEIEVRGVGGSVTVDDDGSGSIEVQEVKGSVVVRNDGSGSIRVQDVDGDFSVRRDGSGGIEHHGVRGQVAVPRGKD